MRSHDAQKDAEAETAAWEATKGAGIGAMKWGAAFLALGGVGYAISPIYRGLTIQFKVYLQMSGMVIGSMMEADHRLRQFEARMRIQRKIARDRAAWKTLERELEKEDDDE